MAAIVTRLAATVIGPNPARLISTLRKLPPHIKPSVASMIQLSVRVLSRLGIDLMNSIVYRTAGIGHSRIAQAWTFLMLADLDLQWYGFESFDQQERMPKQLMLELKAWYRPQIITGTRLPEFLKNSHFLYLWRVIELIICFHYIFLIVRWICVWLLPNTQNLFFFPNYLIFRLKNMLL